MHLQLCLKLGKCRNVFFILLLPVWNSSLPPLCSSLSEDLPMFRLKRCWSASEVIIAVCGDVPTEPNHFNNVLKPAFEITHESDTVTPFRKVELLKLSIWIPVDPSQTRSWLELYSRQLICIFEGKGGCEWDLLWTHTQTYNAGTYTVVATLRDVVKYGFLANGPYFLTERTGRCWTWLVLCCFVLFSKILWRVLARQRAVTC